MKPYHFNFFKGCLTKILLGPFLNTLPHLNFGERESQKKFPLTFWADCHGNESHFLTQMKSKNISFKYIKFAIKSSNQ